MNFGDLCFEYLKENKYTTVFYVAGGNIMHLLDSARKQFKCIPVLHEVSAVIAAEYFNETNSTEKAFALVTAGPGLTNCVTGIAGSWLESREVLIIGGQVKTSDLKRGNQARQKGIQEIDGVSLVKTICKSTVQMNGTQSFSQFCLAVKSAHEGRPGPVFIEFCLDVQALPIGNMRIPNEEGFAIKEAKKFELFEEFSVLRNLVAQSSRPVLLIGGGISRVLAAEYVKFAKIHNLPVMTTWNGADRVSSQEDVYFGRPNTWGQRHSNIILQQADLLLAIGTRLGLQQTGFNIDGFMPLGKIIHVDIDKEELKRAWPRVALALNMSAVDFFEIFKSLPDDSFNNYTPWLNFAKNVMSLCPVSDPFNSMHDGFFNPYDFVLSLSNHVDDDAVIIPCSSGGAFTSMMQSFQQRSNQILVTNKGLASMGYGLAGAIGASFANLDKQVILVEGDGGFTQNLQELGTVSKNSLPIKIFIFANSGYASIRMTQKNYFDGKYMGCDEETGLGLPDWSLLFAAFGISCQELNTLEPFDDTVISQLADFSPRAFIVKIHPEQTYYPKISSRLLENGSMESNPLHLMTPALADSVAKRVFEYLPVDFV